MAIPKKKASRNAYFFFALDMMPVLKQRGLQVSGVKDAIPLCSEEWALLSPDEKQKYADKAKNWKSRDPEVRLAKRDSERFPPGKDRYTEDVSRQHREKLYMKTGDLERKVICIINIFSHGDMPSLCEQKFVPCELGCVRYSLQDGILGFFHEFIDPGDLPLGFRYYCQAGSSSTHQIPVTGFELANHDYQNLYYTLCDFVSSVPGLWTTVYCRSKDLYRVKWCLQWLADKAGMKNAFELQDIEGLIIKYFRDKLDEEPSKFSVHRLLDVVRWDYANNTRCKWHEDNDMSYCALASCKKIAYCMSKALASVYGITLTANHLPAVMPQDGKTSSNAKTVVLDPTRYQKKMDHGYRSEEFDGEGATGETRTLGMRGVLSMASNRGRGRGILRLLEEMPSFLVASDEGAMQVS